MKKLLIGTLVSLSLVACKKEQPTVNSQSSKPTLGIISSKDGPVLLNGVLHFESLEDFNQQINLLSTMSESELEDFNQNYLNGGFTSLILQYYLLDLNSENGKGISADSAIQTKQIVNIQDNWFASLLNKEAMIVIADSIYQFLPNDEVKVTSKDKLRSTGTIDWSAGMKLYLINNWGDQNWASMNPYSHFFVNDNNDTPWPRSNNKQVRAVHTKWCTYYVFYASIGAKMRMERHGIFGWVNIKHTEAKFNQLTSHWRWMEQFGTYVNEYTNITNNSTYNQNVNQNVFGYQVSPIPYLFSGHFHYKVGTFKSNITITYGGKSKTDVWIH